uniref:Rib/alpha-like domain-containing protein n=1 Tax=Lactobacillus intestinalis TaxID=151781 RepID=UPI00242F6B2C
PDGSKDEVPVTIHVTNPTTDADKYTPEGQDVNTKTGVVPDPAEGIKNKSDLPDGTKYTWKDTPDVTTAGDKPATVVVTYPDGSKDEVPVTIHVTNPTTDADKYTPEGQDVNTKTGVVPDPAEGIKNKSDLPDGTKYTWKDTPNVTTAGNKPAVVVVTYPDGSKDEVPVTIHVTNPSTPIPTPNPSSTDADDYTPQGQDIHTTVGKVPNASEGIANKSDLPAGTTYSWQNTPDVSTTGTHPETIIVTYPDGSKDEVTVNVIASNPDPEGQKIIVKQGETPNPADGIKNKSDLPVGTKYTWKDTPDTKTLGEKTATIVVTYPDGTRREITVPIDVTPTTPSNTDADKYKPEGKDINTDQGKVPNPSDGIRNKNDLPDGTKYTWKNTPDVSTPGKHSATIVITYPDGSKDKVTITITVKGTTTLRDNNGSSQDNGSTTQTTRGSSSSTLTHINNESPKEQFVSETQEMSVPSTKSSNVKTHTSVSQRSLPQTGEESKSGIIGLAIATLGSLFGFASTKKRKRN